MFGYVLPYRMELKVKDYERFKSYYCGLCHSIKSIYGNMPRISLNYDMTFLSILLDALIKEENDYNRIVCALHPTQKKIILKNSSALDYSAHINVALFYYKLVDDINDDKSLKAKLMSVMFVNSKNLFSKKYSTINEIINTELNDLTYKELNHTNYTLDEIAHPFGNLTGELMRKFPGEFINDSQILRDNLYNLGYNLGKWIYLIDALDDLKEDMEKKKFNVFNNCLNDKNLSFHEFYHSILQRAEFSLLSYASQCYNSFMELNVTKNNEILDNILKLGLMDKLDSVIKKYEDNNSTDRRTFYE
ncbi:DUF5685 family protein [Clostridium sp. C8-1-8]|uniref:DUF5685 family protein n=1 Tax=Clostridium sp. C8-1-8 TaxID=2698831 RepID=UPI00136BE8FF|nr:DUF5685 family protein [Clostridium sp. C8-1-8]